MDEHRPLIGITPGYDYSSEMLYVKKGYYEGIIKAGGICMSLPMTGNTGVLDDIIERCEGFLICGGPDIDAQYYGEGNLPYNGEISPCRDFLELYVIRKAIEYKKPLLGICRGIQSINVALGGTLYQDIYSQVKDRDLVKHSQNAPKWYPTHDINIEKGSLVWRSFMKERIGVNSFHHQAVKEVAPGFVVTSRSVDGIIESIEHTEHEFTVGVQWHPELMWQENEIYLGLFKEFVNKAGKASSRRK